MKKMVFIIVLMLTTQMGISASEYTVNTKEIPPMVTPYSEDRVSASSYQNPEKMDSGMTYLSVTSGLCGSSEFEVAEIIDNTLEFVSCESTYTNATQKTKEFDVNDGNDVIIYNNQFVFAEKAIAATKGGISYTGLIYPTVTDAYNGTNGITISGAGFDMAYYGTVQHNNKLFYEIKVGGLHGYMKPVEASVIPIEFVNSQSYYTTENDQFVMYSTNDPLEGDYSKLVLGPSMPGMQAGKKYYSYDDINYYTSPLTDTSGSTRSTLSGYSYWQWMPLRSTSNYTAQDYKSYLTYVGCDDGNPNTGSTTACGGVQSSTTAGQSEYYNETDGFTSAQQNYGINSLLLFSMANHESAYGSSTFARNCHNFFGWGAYDDTPENACDVAEGGVYFPKDDQVDDAIQAQAYNLSTAYLDIADWRYYGSHVGNKTTGLNVKYASDPDWGKHIASKAYEIDSYLSGFETGFYKIGKTNQYTQVYTTSSGSTEYMVSTAVPGSNGTQYEYAFKRGGVTNSSGSSTEMPVLIVEDTANRYKITLPTPVKQSSNETCKNVVSNSGYYPNYGGTAPVNVGTGYANYSCTYSWDLEYGYVDKSDITVINDTTPKYPNSNYEIVDFPQPVVMKTLYSNVPTFYGNIIPKAGTYLPITSVVKSGNTIVGYIYVSDLETGEIDAIEPSNLSNLSASADNVKIGETDPTSISGSKLSILSSPSLSSTIEAYVGENNIPFVVESTTNGQSVNGDKVWANIYYDENNTNLTGYVPNSNIDIYNPTSFVGYDNKVYMDGSGNVYFDGYAYIKYLNCSTDAQIDHTISLVNSSGITVSSAKMTDNTNYQGTTNGHEEDVYNYAYAGYSGKMNVANLNLSNGTYTFKMSVDQAGYLINSNYNIHGSYSYDQTYYINGKNYRLYTSSNTLKLEVTSSTPTNYNGYDNKVTMDGEGNITLQGYAYIPYIDIPTASDVTHAYRIKDDSTGVQVDGKTMTDTTTYKSTTDAHEEGIYNYDYAGYKYTFNVTDKNIPVGEYTFKMYIQEGGVNLETDYHIHSSYSIDQVVYEDGKLYRLYTSNGKLKLSVSNYNPTDYSGYDNVVSMDSKGNITLKGYAYIPYVNIPTANDVTHAYRLYDDSTNLQVNGKTMSDTTDYKNTMESHEGGMYNYDYSGYKYTFNITDQNIPVGEYTFKMYIQAGNESLETNYKVHSSYSIDKTVYSNGKLYRLYTSSGKLKLTVSEYNPTKYSGYDNKVTMDDSGNITLKGYAYIPYVNIPTANDVIHAYRLYDDATGQQVNGKTMSDTTDYKSTMESHENGMYNYDYSGYKYTFDVTEQNIPVGEYTFKMYVQASGESLETNYVIHSSYSFDKTVYDNGKSYRLYTTNGKLKLTVTNATTSMEVTPVKQENKN